HSDNYSVYGDYPVSSKIATKQIYNGGRFLNDEDIKYRRKVCVIGEKAEADLFQKGEKAVGEFIRIDNIYFQVVGVVKYKEGGGMDSDTDIHIPFTTFQRIYNTGDNVGWFAIAAYDDVDVVQVEKDIKTTLRKIHSIHPEDERAIGSFNLGEMFGRIMGFSKGMTFLSLIVGI
ncbi:MAG: ABC transporter permease, partial [Flavobacteriaceae bacterium]|nr:ABC transporter permease [Flavobacteriaceae bacterium]